MISKTYVALCDVQACVEDADPSEVYQDSTGRIMALWWGSEAPCDHIKSAVPDWESWMDEN